MSEPFEQTDNPYLDAEAPFDLDGLLNVRATHEGLIAESEGQIDLIDEAIGMQMHAKRAEVYENETAKITFQGKTHWLEDVLQHRLRALMDDVEFEAVLNAIPKPRPRTIDKRKLPALAKLGGDYKDAIEEAKRTGPAELKITRK